MLAGKEGKAGTTVFRRLLRLAAWCLFAVYALLVAFMVLWPSHIDDNSGGEALARLLEQGHSAGWLPAWFTYATVEWLSNLVMFVPGGFLLALLLPARVRHWVPALGLATTCGIETIQHFMPDRTSSYLDILANSLGALVGYLLALISISLGRKYLKRF